MTRDIDRIAMSAAEDLSGGNHTPQQNKGQSKGPISYKIVADLVMLIDGLAIFLAGLLSHYFYFSLFADGRLQLTITASFIGALLTITIFQRRGLYLASSIDRWWEAVGNIIANWAIAFLTIVTIGFLVKISGTYSRGWVISWFVSGLASLFVARIIVSSALKHPSIAPALIRRVAVVGSGEQARQVVDHLHNSEQVEIVGIYANPLAPANAPEVLSTQGQIQNLLEDIQTKHIYDVILALHHDEEPDIWAIAEMLAEHPVSVRLAPEIFDLKSSHLKAEKIGSVATTTLLSPPLVGWNRIIKGLEDRILASAFLLFFAPLFLFVAIAIKLESKGPVFFVQRRHGFNHEIIPVIKFRSMSTLEDGSSIVQATRNDSRITRVGSFLRRSSMDELPQLLNVLKGQMSIVGPRPHAVAHNEMYATMIRSYSKRHTVKPGITGWAQINGYRGETRDKAMMEKRVEYDLFYIENWSLWLDLKIILLTPFRGLIHANAY